MPPKKNTRKWGRNSEEMEAPTEGSNNTTTQESNNTTTPRVALSQCTPDTFEDGDMRLYLEKFEMTGKANRWDEGICTLRLPLFLKGRAFIHYQELQVDNNKWDWSTLKMKLIETFHPVEERMSWLRRFYDRKLRAAEPLETLAADLKRMLRFALPEKPLRDVDIILKFQFLQALPTALVRRLDTHSHTLTFDQLVAKARLFQLDENDTAKREVHNISTRKPDEYEEISAQIQNLQLEVQQIRNQNRPRLQCSSCGRGGHRTQDCYNGTTRAVGAPTRVTGNGRGTWAWNRSRPHAPSH